MGVDGDCIFNETSDEDGKELILVLGVALECFLPSRCWWMYTYPLHLPIEVGARNTPGFKAGITWDNYQS